MSGILRRVRHASEAQDSYHVTIGVGYFRPFCRLMFLLDYLNFGVVSRYFFCLYAY